MDITRTGTVHTDLLPTAVRGPSPEESQRRRTALEAFAFPAGLAGRLQREQGWDPVHTEAVLGEYRRFLILAATQGVSVTPSQTVDHAWHAHLEYTHSYWDQLCGEVLGEPLHHTPGEPGDDGHFQQAYLDTLDLYHATFGTRPPELLWPDPRRQFLHKAAPRRTGARLPRWLPGLLFGGLALLGLWTLLGRMPLLIVGVAVLLVLQLRRLRLGVNGRWRAQTGSSDGSDLGGFAVLFGSDGDSGHHGDGCDSGNASCGSSCGSSCGGGCGS